MTTDLNEDAAAVDVDVDEQTGQDLQLINFWLYEIVSFFKEKQRDIFHKDNKYINTLFNVAKLLVLNSTNRVLILKIQLI